MKPKQDIYDVGVIVGRFQVPELHDAHKDLIGAVCEAHDKVFVFLGLSVIGQPTRENPLDFQARKQMLLEEFPQLNVLYIKDLPDNDELWSRNLDGKIQDIISPNQKPVLYGGRDSFIAHYRGKFPTLELEPEAYVNFSGTEARRAIARMSTGASPQFRKGVIWTTQSKHPTCFPTVDVAILSEDEREVLLAKKPHEDGWRFIGGFADPKSPSYEADVRREVSEEAHIAITDPMYIDSILIDDPRYRVEQDKIKTLFFVAKYQSGSPQPDDDIAELRWFHFEDLFSKGVAGKSVGRTRPEIVVPTHYPLMEMLKKYLYKS